MNETNKTVINKPPYKEDLRLKFYLNLGALLAAIGSFIGIMGIAFVIYAFAKYYQDFQLVPHTINADDENMPAYQARKKAYIYALVVTILISIYYILLILVTMKETLVAAIN
jgi:hypothetical protein